MLGELRDDPHPLVRVEKREQWRQSKPRYPVGSTLSAQVERTFPFNHEYRIRFTGGDSQNWSGALLPQIGQQSVAGSTGSCGCALT
jgi:hypothetical protein